MALLPVEYDTEAHRCIVTADLLDEVMQKRHTNWPLGTLPLRLSLVQEYVCVGCRLHCDAGYWPSSGIGRGQGHCVADLEVER